MRLLLECYACDPNNASESFNAWRWTYGLAETGHEVDLLTTEVGSDSVATAIQRMGLGNIRLHTIPRNRRLLKFKFGHYLDYVQWLNRAAAYSRDLKRPDVAHHISWGNIAFGTRLWRLGVPTVLGPCGGGQVMEPHLMKHLEVDRTFEHFRSMLVRQGSRVSIVPNAGLNFCHVLASNDATEKFARARSAKSVEIFADPMLDESGISSRFQPRPARSRLQVLWAGRMLPRKGIELAIRAFAKAQICADLHLVGDGPRMSRARQLVAELGLEDSVRFSGSLTRTEVAAAMAEADLFLFVSLRDSMPVQLLEAMSAGLPIVCLDAYGNGLLVPDPAGIKIAPSEPVQIVESIAEALRTLSGSVELRGSMGSAGFIASRQHLWTEKIQRMEKVYKRVVNGSQP